MLIHDPGGVGFVIEEVWAYLSVHEDGDEGIIGAFVNDMLMPLVAADKTRLDNLRPHAEATAQASGRQVKLVRFDRRTDVEVIEP